MNSVDWILMEKVSLFNQKPYQLTRIAPTPSGYLHLGNVYSFAQTAALAHRTGAEILLRIDDLDTTRTAGVYIEDIFSTLEFLDIPWHRGPRNPADLAANWSQRLRLTAYRQALDLLRESGKLYACRCSRKKQRESKLNGCAGNCREQNIGLDSDDVSWRLITDNVAEVTAVIEGEVRRVQLPVSSRDFIVRRRDGIPAYHLCSVVDDEMFGTDLVVRGADLYESSVAQLFLARELGCRRLPAASFVHHKLLLSGTGSKLSKSAGDTAVKTLRENGKTMEQVYRAMSELAGLPAITHWRELPGTLPI